MLEQVSRHTHTSNQPLSVVLSGSYRRSPERLRTEHEELLAQKLQILSPTNVDIQSEVDGFVYMRGETHSTPHELEARHLDAIERADFVWLHAPEGYVGPSAALEVGFASACGVPVFAREMPKDEVLRPMVQLVEGVPHALERLRSNPVQHPRALRTFQHYYRRVAVQRGYEREAARDCVLLMLEEVGELARAVRKQSNLTRHHRSDDADSAVRHELADVFLYVVHMANILECDLPAAVSEKERMNHERFLQSLTKR